MSAQQASICMLKDEHGYGNSAAGHEDSWMGCKSNQGVQVGTAELGRDESNT